MGKRRKLTYVDSDILRAAFKGDDTISVEAMKVIDDPERTFAASIYLQLELLPKPSYFQMAREKQFYETFFGSVDVWAEVTEQLAVQALDEAKKIGAGAMDALHLACAAQVHADELITGERESKPIFRTSLVRLTSLRPSER